MPEKSYEFVWLAAGIRRDIDRLNEAAERADKAKAPKIATEFRDIALQLANLYEKCIKLAAPSFKPAKRKDAFEQEDLPF